jgi:hypothetical protein
MIFTLSEDHLRRLCEINSFDISINGMGFFGFRGCIPANEDNYEFQKEHQLILIDINYINPRCTLGQWLPQEGTFALYPGSTVPHIQYVKDSKERNGVGANQLMTGYYKDYRKGVHRKGGATAHDAFRQTDAHPIRRTADDFDYDSDDRVEFTNPYDNIHAAWCMGIDHDYYASAGCQVIVGYPKCEKLGQQPDLGPWAFFKKNAYDIKNQKKFPYILLNGRDAQKVVFASDQEMSARLRYGSKGALVKKLQTQLKNKDFYEGNVDGDFGPKTIRAVLQFQTDHFGPSADDGIVGPITASALGIEWPSV